MNIDLSSLSRIGELSRSLAMYYPSCAPTNELIQQAADYQHKIEQIRRLKADLLARFLAGDNPSSMTTASNMPQSNSPGRTMTKGPLELGLSWQRLDRYERRALYRRQVAFRELDQELVIFNRSYGTVRDLIP